MRWIGILSAGLVLVVLSACSGASSSGTTGSGDLPRATASEAPAPNPAAKAAAEAALLTVSDFPPGWSTSPQDNSDDDSDEFDEKIANCMHVDPGVIGGKSSVGADVDSPDFNSPDDTSAVASETVSIDTKERIDAGFAAFRSPLLDQCFNSLMGPYLKNAMSKDASTSDATIGDATTGSLSFPKLGDDSLAFRITVPLTISGQSVSVYVDLAYVRVGEAVAELSFEDVFSPFDISVEGSIAHKAYKKLSSVDIPAV